MRMNVMRYLPLILALLWWPPPAIATQTPSGVILKADARAEVAAALYAASATQAAAEKVADTRVRAQRQEIESLRARMHEGELRLRSELAAAEEKYVAALAARDRAYAQEIAVFRNAVESIAATPEGVAALARFNAGDEVGALAVLDDLRAAQDAAEKKSGEIKSATRGRHNAMLALEARNRGKVTTAQVIARFEEVARLDPGVHWDWVELGRLYMQAGKLPGALRAAKAAADTAQDDRDRSVALNELGDVQVAQGNLPAALASYQASHDIFERLAKADPGNTDWQRDLSVSHIKIGDVQIPQGNLPAALASFQASLAIRERLSQVDPGNAEWQRDLMVSYVKMNGISGDKAHIAKALETALAMKSLGILAPRDAWLIEELKRHARK